MRTRKRRRASNRDVTGENWIVYLFVRNCRDVFVPVCSSFISRVTVAGFLVENYKRHSNVIEWLNICAMGNGGSKT